MISDNIGKHIKFFLLIILMMLFTNVAYAAATSSDILTSSFLTELSDFIKKVLHDSAIKKFVDQIMVAFLFFMIVWEIIFFLYSGLDWSRIFEKVMWGSAAFLILSFYDPMTSAMWGMAEGLGADIQYIAVGNRDVFFLPNWSMKMFDLIKTEDVDIWDSLVVIILGIVWYIISALLNLVLIISSFFAMFGYALAKITGVFFIPFILFQGTRNYFDGWVRFFIGFVILAIILRINAVIIAILVKAQCSSVIGNSLGFELPTEPIYISLSGQTGSTLLNNLIFSGVVGIFFVLSSFSFASTLAAGSGSACGSIGRTISGVRRLIFK